MIYPIRVINNRIKNKILPALDIERGEFREVKHESKPNNTLLIVTAAVTCILIISILAGAYVLIAEPLIDIMRREKALAATVQEINGNSPDVTLTRLLQEHDILITHRASFGDAQAVITIANEPDLALLLYITSQVPGVFSLQHSPDGFQIFIAGGSV